MSQVKKKWEGFTLVEVLVCIGILFILFAIVSAYASSVIEKRNQSVCIAQQRQLISAVNMYRYDYDGDDEGNSVEALGLPKHLGYVFRSGYLRDNTDIQLCPSRMVASPWKEKGAGYRLISYQDWHSYPDAPFIQNYTRDHNWPAITCRLHDSEFWKENPGRRCRRCRIIGISLSGTIVRVTEP